MYPYQDLSSYLFPSMDQSKPAPKSKTQLNTLRAGDWICLLCNNLNFSFRNECNRCQRQTKKQNFMQNILLLDNNIILPEAEKSQKNALFYLDKENIPNPKTNPKVNSNPNSLKPRKVLSDLTNYIQNNATTREEWLQGQISDRAEKNENNGFENVLLLTPPKSVLHSNYYGGEKAEEGCGLVYNSPNSDTFKKLMKPYQSPKQLPSVSPILKGEFLSVIKEIDFEGKSFQTSLFERINEENIDLEEEYYSSGDDHTIYKAIDSEEYMEQPNPNQDFEDIINKIMDDENTVNFQRCQGNSNNHQIFANGMKEEKKNNLFNSLKVGLPEFNFCKENFEGKKQKKKEDGERKSDWICANCKNLNYSFRVICNRCQIPKP